jgi:UDP-N-acetylglucosamine 2-epimerase (non-hydrolysing)
LRVLVIFGTRPEAIKLAPLIHELERKGADQVVCVTGQQREMLQQMLTFFQIKPDADLNIMSVRQSLEDITRQALDGIEAIIKQHQPDIVVVQGDTTTAFVGALAAYYQKIPVAHVEAGLRTNNIYNPFPEEMNRRMISQIATLHFAPTQSAADNLLANGVDAKSIHITGNTVVDAIMWGVARKEPFHNRVLADFDFDDKQIVLITTHRRENLGRGLFSIYTAITRLASEFPKVSFFFPVHLNPQVQAQAQEALGKIKNVLLIEPLDYPDIISLIAKSSFIMTDSGGIQEEAPSLGKPVLVLRDTTEREEGIAAGTAKLVGSNEQKIYTEAKQLLTNKAAYQEMSQASNPYGDGQAAKRIADILMRFNQ